MLARKLICIVSFTLVVTGCVSPNYDYVPRRIEISEPPIDSIVTAFVGDQMLHQGSYREHDAIFLRRETQVGLLGLYTFSPGYYFKQGDDNEDASGFYLPSPHEDGGRVTENGLADPFRIIQTFYDRKRICGVSIFNGTACTNETDYDVTTQQVIAANAFQQTLIYSGRVGDKVNVGYREFSGNMARPAFNNDVEYDMSESKIIGYSGARLEILEATNEFVRYKVLSNFNRAEF